MILKKIIQGLSIKKKFFLSFLIIFTIPLASMIFLNYRWMLKNSYDKINQSNLAIMKNVVSFFDKELKACEEISVSLSQMTWVKKIENLNQDYENLNMSDIFYIQEFSNQMSLLVSHTSMINNMAVCFNNNEIVAANSTLYSYKQYFNEAFCVDNYTLDSWRHILLNHKVDILNDINVKQYAVPSKGIIYKIPMVVQKQNISGVTLLAYIKQNTINDILSSLQFNKKSCFLVLDKNKEVLVSQNAVTKDLNTLKDIDYPLGEELINKEYIINGESSKVFYRISPYNSWIYISTVPSDSYMANMNNISLLTLIMVVISSIIGMGISYKIASINYKPFSKLIAQVKIRIKGDYSFDNKDEFRWLENTIMSILDNNIPVLINTYLRDIVEGRSKNVNTVIDELKLLGISYSYDFFRCIIIKTEKADDLKNITTLVKNIAEEYSGILSNEVVIKDVYKVYIINYGFEEDMELFMEEIYNSFSNSLEQVISMGIGNSYTKLFDISNSYSEALIAIDYAIINESEIGIIYYEKIQRHGIPYYYPIDKELNLSYYLKSGNFEEASKLFYNIEDKNIRESKKNYRDMRQFYQSILITAIKVIQELEISDKFDIRISDIYDIYNLKDMKNYILDCYKQICTYINDRHKAEDCSFSQILLEYISKNVTDPRLSLTQISSKFNVSVSHISNYCKEHYGWNFNYYVTKQRIELAKKMIAESDEDLASISRNVGYEDIGTFRRVFKKIEGVTPGKYKENIH